MAQPGGVLNRAGHTEAAADLALLAGFEPAGVLVEILNPDGSMARRPQLEAFAREHGLKIGSIEDLIRYRLDTEHTVECIDSREIDTDHGRFLLHTWRDRLTRGLHYALVRGEVAGDEPVLVRVQQQNPLADALHWRRADFGPLVGDVLAMIAADGRGVLVLLGDAPDAEATLARIREQPAPPASKAGALAQWRRNGAGSQILAALGVRHLRVLGTPRRQVGLAGFGLEVVEYVVLPAR
jgi:3,4-dihydroxy 2-butanone 4-phosphate synthase/GTP cyclohydrolase II